MAGPVPAPVPPKEAMMSDRRTIASALVLPLALALLLALPGCASMFGQSPGQPGSTSTGAIGKEMLPATQQDRLAQSAAPAGAPSPGNPTAATSGGSAPAAAVRLVVRNKSMTMQVKDARKAAKAVEALASKFGGYVTDVSISSLEGQNTPVPEIQQSGGAVQQGAPSPNIGPFTATATAKIPAARFEAFLAQVRTLGTVESEQESQEDVTQQNIDMTARLKNLRAEEAQFVRFFSAAKNVRDMLEIEGQLARVRGDIESLTAQLDYLHQNVAMATLSVTMHEPPRLISPAGPQGWGVVKAITQAIRNFVDVVNFLIMAIGALLPFVIILIVIILVIRWSMKRSRATRPPAKTESGQAGPDDAEPEQGQDP
jgi:hypothetical protein